MNSKLLASVVLAVAVAGCTSKAPEPTVQIEIREVLVPQKCIKPEEIPAKPEYLTRVGPYPGGAAAAKILARDFKAAKAYGRSMEVLLVGCALDAVRATE
ncbi:hypothetical protein [Pseudomonas atacamensis]|uniref:hypothetical protein n=1 Tax=Pseudomonas atacamensis TaxID=2565368 RepID=UPI0019D1559E|nr:hypothetical protein [Pseudomonas atacamensis]QSL90457.1 hypothetical protein JWU58_26835 [Pseudomonas atacamensis]